LKSRNLLVFQAMILVISIGPASAQFEGAVWEVLTSDTLQHALGQSPLASTPAGLHLTYAKSRGTGSGWTVYYRFFSLTGGWEDPAIVESSIPAFEPSVAAREFGTFKIGVFYDAGGDIYGDVVNSPWEAWDPVNLTNTGDFDRSVTAAVDMEATVHLSWVTETNGEYKIAYGTMRNDSFSMEILQESELGDFGSGAAPFTAVVDSVPHLFYRGVNGPNYHIHHAYKIAPDSAWNIEFLYTPNIDDFQGSAAVDNSGDLHLAISGNTGWGTPGRIYYMKRSNQTGDWSAPDLVTGTYSVVDGHIGITSDGVVFVAGAGISGNIYTGDIYLSDNSSGTFEPAFLVNYPDGVSPALAFLPGPLGALVMRGIINHPGFQNEEIIYYGPQPTYVEDMREHPVSIISSANYPNPFNSNTVIRVRGLTGVAAGLKVYDILGRKIAELEPSNFRENELIFRWDGLDSHSRTCAAGAYYYLIEGQNGRSGGSMIYLK
jgi:hypothetical protein